MPHLPASQALARFRVIDLTQVRAGPTAARQLADWGADVIQVQMPEHMRGDDTLGGQEGSDYQYTHRNKRSITLNLKEPEGIDALKKLVATADVVLENFRPDVKARLGIDYDALSKINPRLVYASISGFGQTGPYATRPGFDQIAQGMGGLMSVTGLPGQGPLRVGLPIADLCAGIFAAYGVTVALLERDASGKGQWLHMSLLEAQIYMMDFQTSRWTLDGEIPGQAGNFHPTSIPTGVYRTQDGYINIAVFGGKIWERFAEAMGAPEWIEDERSKTKTARSVHHIRFNNPEKHNALSVDMWEAVPPLLDKAEKDGNVRMVVLSGEGGKSFISGADISQFEDMRAAKQAVTRYESMAEAALQGLYEFGKPTVACIRGYCIGGGVNGAISCDIRIASSSSG